MTEDDIKRQIGEAAIERKTCLDKISCYEARLKDAAYKLQAIISSENEPLHADNQRIVDHASDPRSDAKNYIRELERANELAAFLRKHNAL